MLSTVVLTRAKLSCSGSFCRRMGIETVHIIQSNILSYVSILFLFYINLAKTVIGNVILDVVGTPFSRDIFANMVI